MSLYLQLLRATPETAKTISVQSLVESWEHKDFEIYGMKLQSALNPKEPLQADVLKLVAYARWYKYKDSPEPPMPQIFPLTTPAAPTKEPDEPLSPPEPFSPPPADKIKPTGWAEYELLASGDKGMVQKLSVEQLASSWTPAEFAAYGNLLHPKPYPPLQKDIGLLLAYSLWYQTKSGQEPERPWYFPVYTADLSTARIPPDNSEAPPPIHEPGIPEEDKPVVPSSPSIWPLVGLVGLGLALLGHS